MKPTKSEQITELALKLDDIQSDQLMSPEAIYRARKIVEDLHLLAEIAKGEA